MVLKTTRAVIATKLLACSILITTSIAAAQNATPSSQPLLKPYNDWVRKNIETKYARYWRIYNGGPDREPYVIYCKDEIFGDEALKGKKVRVRSKSAAQQFFPKITGETGYAFPASGLNEALKSGVIDCLGFGGEVVSQTPSGASREFSRETIETAARSLKVDISNDHLLYKSMDVLDWKFYRAINGDLGTIYQLFGSYLSHAKYENSAAHFHFAGFWAVRALEYMSPQGTIANEELVDALRGNCKGREELCKGIQIELSWLGKYFGEIDGVIGSGTRAAVNTIIATRPSGDPNQLKTLEEFVADRQSPADPGPTTKPAAAKPKPMEPSPPKVTDNLDDF